MLPLYGAIVPAAQDAQDRLPSTAAIVPGSHSTHSDRASSCVPAGHVVQLVLPVPGATVPAAQNAQLPLLPALSANDPSAHGTHAVWLSLLCVPAGH